MELIQYRVTGTVQGVFFRQSTQKEATKLGVRGWCHNHPDSSVEGVAVGPPDKIKQFRAFLDRGPSQAQVDKVEIVKQKSGLSEEQAKQELGTDGAEYEVRRYKR